MKTLENSYIILRNLSLDDMEDMYEYAQSNEVGPNAGWEPHKSKEETKRIIESMIKSNEVWGIYHKDDEKLIGTIGVHFGKYPITDTNVHSLGFVLNPNYWGKGIMRMACDLVLLHTFKENDVMEVYGNHFTFNKRSGRFMKKYGMELVGEWYSKMNNRGNALYKITKDSFVKKRNK